MSDLVARLRLEGQASGLVAATAQGEKALQQVRRGADQAKTGLEQLAGAERVFSQQTTAASAAAERLDRQLALVTGRSQAVASGLSSASSGAAAFERSASGAHQAGLLLGSTLALLGGRELVRNIQEAAFAMQGYETGFEAVTHSASSASAQLGFVREQAARLGLNVRDATRDFLQLTAATAGTKMQGEATRQMFVGLNEAGAALHLTSERMGLAQLALNQIASKGVVSMEDLRQQLGEALPGALAVAARAMGQSQAQFIALVGSGKLLSEDFLPKFAAQLHKEYGPALDAALSSPLGRARVELANFKNTLFDLETAAGGEFLKGLTDGVGDLNKALAGNGPAAAKAFGRDLGEALAAGAQGAAFLVEHLNEITGAAKVLLGIGLARWFLTAAGEARQAAVAFVASGAAAVQAGEAGAAAATDEAVAVTSLRAAVQAVAVAEGEAAGAAVRAALAHEQAAAAALAEARANIASTSSSQSYAQRQALVVATTAEVTAARNASAAAAIRAEAATAGLAAAETGLGVAAGAASGVMGGLLNLVGGPWGLAFMAAGAAVAFVIDRVSTAAAEARALDEATRSGTEAVKENAVWTAAAGGAVKGMGDYSMAALSPVAALTGETNKLADATFRVAAANKLAAMSKLQGQISEQQTTVRKRQAALGNARGFSDALGTVQELMGAPTDRAADAANDPGVKKAAAALAFDQRNLGLLQGDYEALKATSLSSPTLAPTPIAAGGLPSKTKKGSDRAAKADLDLAAQVVALQAYRVALSQGGQALDDWRVKDAGRQALEHAGLAEKPKLTAAEQAHAASIRDNAEASERLKIANERVEKAIGLQRTADLDTAALRRRADAAGQGQAALDELRVKEAGLQAMQTIGIQTLDQLSGADRKAAEAAIAAAEGKERQAIATERAEKVAATVEDLDRQIVAEKGRAAALAAGVKAEIDYARAEAVRAEIERTGKNLTDEQTAAIKRRVEQLFALSAAADGVADKKAFEDELRLTRMTRQERELEVRTLALKRQLLAQNATLSEQEADAAAREQASIEAAATQRAQDISDLKEGLRSAYIDSGKIGFDQVADYAKKKLRAAVYDAILSKPFDVVINAVVKAVGGDGSQLAAGASDILKSMGVSAQTAAGFSSTISQIASMAPEIAAAFEAIKVGTSFIGKTIGLSDYQQKAADKAASYGAGIITSLVVGLLAGKESNYGAIASLDSNGKLVGMAGNKRTDETEKAATSVAAAIQAGEKALRDAGITLATTVAQIDIGTRDTTHTTLSNGKVIESAVGDSAAAADAALKAILSDATYADPALKTFVTGLVSAGKSIDDIVAGVTQYTEVLSAEKDLRLELLKHTDPRAAALQQLSDQQAARRATYDGYNTAGLLTPERYAEVKTLLDQLDAAELSDALAQLGDAATDAAKALADAKPNLQAWLDQLSVSAASTLNPFEQRNAALTQYQQQLALAQGGDANALANITGYADRLLSADRSATSSAADRQALYDQVTADIAGIVTGPALTEQQAIAQLSTSNATVTTEAAQTIVAAISAPLSVQTSANDNATTAAVEGMEYTLAGRLEALISSLQTGFEALVPATSAGLSDATSATENLAGLMGQVLSELQTNNAYLRASTARTG